MRKLLNRPWFVALLALAALFVVSRAVFSGAKVRGTAGPDPEPTTDSAPVDAETAPRLSVLEALKALGIPATVRDPFALPPKPAEVVADLPGNTVVEVVDKLRLSAVWVQGTAVFLLLNGQICQPGDTVERFTVESADVDGVWVRHASGRSFLAVGRELAVQSTAPGPAAPLSQ